MGSSKMLYVTLGGPLVSAHSYVTPSRERERERAAAAAATTITSIAPLTPRKG